MSRIGITPDLGGRELQVASIVANATSTSVYPTYTDVTGLSVTFVAGSRPIWLIASCEGLINNTVGSGAALGIQASDNTALGRASVAKVGTANAGGGVTARVRLTGLTPGTSYTYKVGLAVITSGTATLAAGSDRPAYLSAIEA